MLFGGLDAGRPRVLAFLTAVNPEHFSRRVDGARPGFEEDIRVRPITPRRVLRVTKRVVKGAVKRYRPKRRVVGTADNATIRENARPGSPDWRVPDTGVTDVEGPIQGYTSATSVNLGGSLDFHVSVAEPQPFTVAIYRIGHYGGAGARQVLVSEPIEGNPQPMPVNDPETGLVDCDWPSAWTLDVPRDWVSGLYYAVFQTRDGVRSTTPFVVRDDKRKSDFLVIVPFTTYQAYNFWPRDGHTARSFYRGYTPDGEIGGVKYRGYQVSFNRPYTGTGIPLWSQLDVAAAQWAEAQGYDVTYASSIDLHEGRVKPFRHAALVFPGHDEYWSAGMRATTERAFQSGTHGAFLAANNCYWHVRISDDGRIVTCYKEAEDPAADRHGRTRTWRSIKKAEQRFIGVQYTGILKQPVPLVVSRSDHWVWGGTGVSDGDEIRDLVAVEADGHYPSIKPSYRWEQTLLSQSPFEDTSTGRGDRVQSTSICVKADGAMMFCAGTFHWPLALVESAVTDKRIQRATKNVFDRFLR